MCATCWLMAESRTPTPFWVLRTPSRAKWCTVRSVAANLGSDIAGYIPVDGVYAGWLVDGENRWPAAISIGTKPTFSEKTGLNERVVEAYCITEEWIDLYDHKVRVEFVGFLRPQVKFDGPDQLVDELKRNVEETKRLTA